MQVNSRSLTIFISSVVVLILSLMAPLSVLYSVSFLPSVSLVDVFGIHSLTLFFNSLMLYGTVTIFAVVISVPIAYFLSRIKIIFRYPLLILFISPLFVPSYIHALSWSRMTSENSIFYPVTNLIFDETAINLSLDGWMGAVWVLSISYYPIILLSVYFACLRWNKRYYNAAILLGTPIRAFFLELKYLQIPILLSALLVFILSFSDFAVPDLFQIRTFSTEIFIQLSAYLDKGTAIAMSFLPMIFFIIMLAYISKKMSNMATTGEIGAHCILFENSTWRYPLFILMWLFALIIVVMPLINLIHMSKDLTTITRAYSMISNDLLTSIIIAGVVSIIAVSTALFVSYGYIRNRLIAKKWIRTIMIMTLVLPASLVSLGLIQIWNRDGWMGWFYQSGLVLIIGLVVRWLPIVFELLLLGWGQINRNQESAGYTVGMSWWRTIKTILFPQLKPAILIAFLICFILAFNEMTMVVLLSPPGLSVLPTRIYSTIHYGPDNLLAAICLIQISFLYILFGFLVYTIKRHISKVRGIEVAVT